MEEALKELISVGPVGILLCIMICLYIRKDKRNDELEDERFKFVCDVKDKYHELVMEINGTLKELAAVIRGKK